MRSAVYIVCRAAVGRLLHRHSHLALTLQTFNKLSHISFANIQSDTTRMAFSFNLGTPVNTALFLYILYSVQRIIFPSTSKSKTIPNEFKSGYSWLPKGHPPTVLYKVYTPKTLEPFHGRDGGRILLAINGIVFDVTAGRNFYGPSGC